MNPSISDDTLVRDLAARTDRSLPAMALDPVGVLAAGHRHRRRQTALRSVGGLALVAVAAAGVLQLGWPDSAPAPATTSTIGSLVIQVPADVDVLTPPVVRLVGPDAGSDDGRAAVDLGVPVSAFDQTPDAGPSTYALMIGTVTVEGDPEPALYLGSVRADGSFDPRGAGGLTGTDPASAASPNFFVMSSEHHAAGVGVLPPGFDGADVELVVVQAGVEQTIEVPTFEVPGLDAEAYFFVAEDPDLRAARWPDMYVRMTAPDGSMSQWGFDGYEPPAVDAARTAVVTVAADVTEVETDIGPAVDLGIEVGADWDPLDEGLMYALRAGPFVDEDTRTPDEAGLWLVTLAPDGSTVAGAGGSVDEALTPTRRSPIWSAGLTDHDAYVVGLRPPSLAGATFELVLETGGDAERTEIPTFRVPGLDADVWFVLLTDPVARTGWQDATIVVTGADGSTSTWNLAGLEVTDPTVASEGP